MFVKDAELAMERGSSEQLKHEESMFNEQRNYCETENVKNYFMNLLDTI